jgi:hypothetical protein
MIWRWLIFVELQSGQGNLSEIFDDNTEQTSQPNKSYRLIALLRFFTLRAKV